LVTVKVNVLVAAPFHTPLTVGGKYTPPVPVVVPAALVAVTVTVHMLATGVDVPVGAVSPANVTGEAVPLVGTTVAPLTVYV
jgi:hypothetical protein